MNTFYKKVIKCRCCDSDSLLSLLSLGTQVQGNIFPRKDEPDPPSMPLNLFICSIETSNNIKGTNVYDLFKQFYLYELQYSLYQTVKILSFFGYKDIHEFVLSDIENKRKYRSDRFQQSTSVFSYFN